MPGTTADSSSNESPLAIALQWEMPHAPAEGKVLELGTRTTHQTSIFTFKRNTLILRWASSRTEAPD